MITLNIECPTVPDTLTVTQPVYLHCGITNLERVKCLTQVYINYVWRMCQWV